MVGNSSAPALSRTFYGLLSGIASVPMADLTPQASLVERWERVTLSERSSYQQHFLDLCDMLDDPKPAASDDEGTSYTFEKRVEKTGGGTGFADVWRRGRFAIAFAMTHMAGSHLSRPIGESSKMVPTLTENCFLQARHFQTLRDFR